MSNRVEKDLQDKLLIEMLDLIEQSVLCKINIETVTNGGQLLLAKSRYIQGPQSVSQSKLPTENTNEFNALKTVTLRCLNDDNTAAASLDDNDLQLNTHKIDKENGFVDPLRWFGVLVPRSLQLAQDRFNRALEIVVECANINLKLTETIGNILLLRNR